MPVGTTAPVPIEGLTGLADAHALQLNRKSPIHGYLRRLHDGTLRPKERVYFERSRQVADLEREGLPNAEIAKRVGMQLDPLRTLLGSPQHRATVRYLNERVVLGDDLSTVVRREQARKRFEGNDTNALDYFDQAFRRADKADEKRGIRRGDFLNMDRAERAAKMFAESAGWTEPLPQQGKQRELKPGVIQQQLRGISAADRKETVVRVTVGDTTVEIGQREEVG